MGLLYGIGEGEFNRDGRVEEEAMMGPISVELVSDLVGFDQTGSRFGRIGGGRDDR